MAGYCVVHHKKYTKSQCELCYPVLSSLGPAPEDELERLRRVERAARGLIDAYPFSLPAYTPYSTKWAALKAALEEK